MPLEAAHIINRAMTQFEKAVENFGEHMAAARQPLNVFTDQVDRLAKLMSMQARNQLDANMGQPPSYNEQDFNI